MTAQTRHRLVWRMHKVVKIIGVVGIGIAGISAMALVAAHGQMNTAASRNGPKAEAGALPGKAGET